MDLAPNEEMEQAIINEERRRRDHGFRLAVLSPTATAAEQESYYQTRLAAGIVDNDEGQDQASASASASAVAEEEEDDGVNDDSGSDEEHEEAYLRSLKRLNIK